MSRASLHRSVETEPAGKRAAVAELDRQLRVLIDKGYPALASVSVEELESWVAPLRAHVAGLTPTAPPSPARVPFVLVISTAVVPAELSMPQTALNGRPGFVDRTAADIERFVPIDRLTIPPGPAYLVLDVDRGAETLNVRPDDALDTITAQGRSPLTVAEGIALVTHSPETLAKNNCFSLVGSRCGDRRVPALWISKGAPKLGWCWAGNPHTWLGSASCAARLGVVPPRLATPPRGSRRASS